MKVLEDKERCKDFGCDRTNVNGKSYGREEGLSFKFSFN